MAQVWSWITTWLNLLGLAVSLCLGFYLVTRSLHSRLAWLAALTLWSVSGVYLHNALLIYLPGNGMLPWLRTTALLAMACGFHLILLLPPDGEPDPRSFYVPALRLGRLPARFPTAARAAVPLAYALACLLIALGAFPLGLPHSAATPIVYLSDRAAARLYPLALAYLLLLVALAVVHLWQGRRNEERPRQRRYYPPLFVALFLTSAGGLYLGLGVWMRLKIPSFPGDMAVGAAALILGYVVARYQARLEGVAIRRDLLYIGLAIGSLTLSYILIAEVMHQGGHHYSTVTLIMIVIVAVSSLMVYDGLRASLDRLFYREHFRQLRASLRALSRDTGIGQGLPERLHAVLGALCTALRVRQGLIAVRDGESFVCQASERTLPAGKTLPAEMLQSRETITLPRPDLAGVEGMALLVPVYAGGEQIAALALGNKETGTPFDEEDLMLLDDLSEQLASMIHTVRLQEENARILSHMVYDFREQEHALQRQVQNMLPDPSAGPQAAGDQEFVAAVEDALRRLYDFSYLGEHSLAQLAVVGRSLVDTDHGVVTHLERGKALSSVLHQAMRKLRPVGAEPKPLDVPPREWHQFLVLHEAYVAGQPNRDIMSRLYIGEGTFNRTRRRALRGLARALREMEGESLPAPAR